MCDENSERQDRPAATRATGFPAGGAVSACIGSAGFGVLQNKYLIALN
ncbi:hypothetical protein [Methylobacterium nigriterrae]